MRESNIGHELKDVAQEVVRFGERCVQAGRDWLNERREEMNHRDDDSRRSPQSGQRYGQGVSGQREAAHHQQGYDDQSDRYRTQQSYAQGQSSRSRGEYYGGGQFDERLQSAGWDDSQADWDYEGGPERYAATGYGETTQQGHRQGQGRQFSAQYGGPRGYSERAGSDYFSGRQGYGARGSFGSDYNTYGRNQGYGEGSGYTRSLRGQQGAHFGSRPGYGEDVSLHGARGYTDEGEMSGYGGRELSTQQLGSGSSGRYGTSPGQYGYGGFGSTGRFRGVGPKNYTRSDERLTEEINERLTDDADLDASEITVRVAEGKVTLEGLVDQRWMKHRAEDIADACIGVKEVDNRIQVNSVTSSSGQTAGAARAGATSRTAQPTTTTGTTGNAGGTTPH